MRKYIIKACDVYFYITKIALKKSEALLFKSKYPELEEQIDKLIETDPSNTLAYFIWQLKQLRDGFKLEDIIPTIEYFHKNKDSFKEKDINKYESLKDLEDISKELQREKHSSNVFDKQAKQGSIFLAKEITEKPILLYRIDNRFASQKLGKDTKWCITMSGASYFEEYSKTNIVFYFIIDFNKEPRSKYHKIAYAVYRYHDKYTDRDNKITNMEIFDSNDTPIKNETVAKAIGNTEIFNKFIAIIEEDANKQPETPLSKISKRIATDEELEKVLELNKDILAQVEYNKDASVEDVEAALKCNEIVYKDLVETQQFSKFHKYFYYKSPNFDIPTEAKNGNQIAICSLDPYRYGHHEKVVVELSLKGNKIAQSKLSNTTENMRLAILNAIANGNKSIIHKLNVEYPEMIPMIIKFAEEGNENCIKKLNANIAEMRPIMLKLAEQGNNIVIEKLNPNYEEFRPIIIRLAKNGNEEAIRHLHREFKEFIPIITELAEQGISWCKYMMVWEYPEFRPAMLKIINEDKDIEYIKNRFLNNSNSDEAFNLGMAVIKEQSKKGNKKAIELLQLTDKESRKIVIDQANMGNETALNRLNPTYEDMYESIIKAIKDNKLPYWRSLLWYNENRFIILHRLAEDGFEKAFDLLDEEGEPERSPKISHFIIELAMKNNKIAIQRLSFYDKEEGIALINLINSGNKYAIERLEKANLELPPEFRDLLKEPYKSMCKLPS